jgi:hypothetical protein
MRQRGHILTLGYMVIWLSYMLYASYVHVIVLHVDGGPNSLLYPYGIVHTYISIFYSRHVIIKVSGGYE